MSTDDRMETITDPAAIRATDEPDERGDFPCCTTPAPVGAAVALDLDAVEAEFLRQCGGCDAGLMVGCTCSQRDFRPTMLALVAEVRRLTAEAATQREWFEAADAAAERRLDQSIAWMERAEAAEAEVVTLRAQVNGLHEELLRDDPDVVTLRARLAEGRRIVGMLAETVESECENERDICHEHDRTSDGSCALLADLLRARAALATTGEGQ